MDMKFGTLMLQSSCGHLQKRTRPGPRAVKDRLNFSAVRHECSSQSRPLFPSFQMRAGLFTTSRA